MLPPHNELDELEGFHEKYGHNDFDNLDNVGKAMSARWAWIKTNGKSQDLYTALNHLGMTVLRRDPILRDLPVWYGSLVQRKRGEGTGMAYGKLYGQDGSYTCKGPLSYREILDLDPTAEFGNGRDRDGQEGGGGRAGAIEGENKGYR